MNELNYVRSSCDKDDVVKYENKAFTLEMLQNKLRNVLGKSVANSNPWGLFVQLFQENDLLNYSGSTIFDKTVDCEVLKTDGGGWKKGKIRFHYVVEITLDEEEEAETSEPASPLDDIRQSLPNNQG